MDSSGDQENPSTTRNSSPVVGQHSFSEEEGSSSSGSSSGSKDDPPSVQHTSEVTTADKVSGSQLFPLQEAMKNADSGSHSSEEELEEINIGNEFMRGSTEKRKWSELTHSEASSESDIDIPDYQPSENMARLSPRTDVSSCDTLSEDEDRNHNKVLPTPVEFSTSPPVDAHKPRRSHSPPPKLFGFSNQARQQRHNNQLAEIHQNQLPEIHQSHLPAVTLTRKLSHHQPGSALHSAVRRVSGLSSSLGDLTKLREAGRTDKKIASPRKRSRKSHLLSRPCLDFEKMQQMQTVTSWQGGELSLFCW